MSFFQLNEEQDSEMVKLIKAVSNTEAVKKELATIFNEAEESGKGRGYKLKSIWKADVSNFSEDQLKNCMSNDT
jgi:acetolactate synthase small subunit